MIFFLFSGFFLPVYIMKYNDEQLEVINCPARYIQVIAAAGSGKTRTMTALAAKVLKQYNSPQDLLVITFTAKAAGEIRERIFQETGLGSVNVKTFHAFCYQALLNCHPEYSRKGIKLIQEEEKNSFLRSLLKKERFLAGGIPYSFFLNSSSSIKHVFPELTEYLAIAYECYKRENDFLDFDDLQAIFLEELKTEKSWTEKIKKQARRIIVDEFQDTDPVQLEILQKLDPEYLCVVGDDWQAIYSFRGASTDPFFNFKNIFSPCQQKFLSTNYRSLPQIIEASEKAIRFNRSNISKKVKSFRTGKGIVKRYKLDDDNLAAFAQDFSKYQSDGKSRILCRSNFRIEQYRKHGVSPEFLSTIHSSKGLEFETIFLDIAGGWNQLPRDPYLLEEERRVLYVGLSRAMNNLVILGNNKQKKGRIEEVFYRYFKKYKETDSCRF